MLDTGVDIGCCTTLHTIIVGLTAVRTLTITSTFAATCASVKGVVTIAGDTVNLAIDAFVAQTVVGSRSFSAKAFAKGFSSTTSFGVVQFDIARTIVSIAIDLDSNCIC